MIGINYYPFLKEFQQLKGCINDVDMLEQVLISKYEFEKDCILKMTSTDRDTKELKPTRETILKALSELHALMQPQAVVLIYFSGHGSQRKNPRKPSNVTETIIPYDSGRVPFVDKDITDDEFREILQKFNEKTKNIILIFDSCHSASMTRSVHTTSCNARYIPPDPHNHEAQEHMNDEEEQEEHREGSRKISVNLNINDKWVPSTKFGRVDYVLLAGCREGEQCYEFFPPKIFQKYGIFTYFLCQELIAAQPNATYYDIFERYSPKVVIEETYQHPEIVGNSSNQLFGLQKIHRDTYLNVIYFDETEQTGAISGGAAHGLTVNSLWSIYPLEVKTKNDSVLSQRLALIQITRVNAVTADFKIVGTKKISSLPMNAHVFEEESSYGECCLKIFLPKEIPSKLNIDKFLKLVKACKLLKEVENPHLADIIVELMETGFFVSHYIEKPILVALTPNGKFYFPYHLLEEQVKFFKNIEKLARYKFIARLENQNEINLTPQKILVKFMKKSSPTSPWEELIGEKVIHEGERIGIQLTNNHIDPIFVCVAELVEDGSINCIYPEEKHYSEKVFAGHTVMIGEEWEGLEISKDYLNFCNKIPSSDITSPKEILKIFVTSIPTNFHYLIQNNFDARFIHCEEDNHVPTNLEQVFELLHFGEKKITKLRTPKEDEWTTFTFVFTIHPDQTLKAWLSEELNMEKPWKSDHWNQYLHGSFTTLGGIFSWLVPKSNNRTTIVKQIFKPESKVSTHLVLIHGLFQDEEETWTDDKGYFWPLWLTKSFRHLAIWTIRHKGIYGKSSLEEITNEVYQELKPKNLEKKHIVFMCHSVGGLIVKKILLQDKTIRKSTRGIVFYGVPTQSHFITHNWALRFCYFPWNTLINPTNLQKYDKEIEGLQTQFNQLVTKKNLRTYNFVESKPTFNNFLLIPKSQFPLQEKKTSHQVYQIVNENHEKICKPISEQDSNFQKLQEFIKSIK